MSVTMMTRAAPATVDWFTLTSRTPDDLFHTACSANDELVPLCRVNAWLEFVVEPKSPVTVRDVRHDGKNGTLLLKLIVMRLSSHGKGEL